MSLARQNPQCERWAIMKTRLTLLFLCITFVNASASYRSWAAYATLRVHSATEDAVVLYLDYTGGSPESKVLSLYDTVRGTRLWRRSMRDVWPWPADTQLASKVIITTNSVLELPEGGDARRYSLDLRSLSWPVTPSDCKHLGLSPDHFWQSISFDVHLTDANEAFISRRCFAGGRYNGSPYFTDWLWVDLSSGRVRNGGRGDILGRTETSALVVSSNRIYSVSSHKKRDLSGCLAKLLPDYEIDPSWERSWGTHHLSCTDVYALFVVRGGETNRAVLFDSRTMELELVTPVERDSVREWALCGDSILRHSICETGTSHWIETYDRKGRWIDRMTLPPQQGHTHLSCLNTFEGTSALFFHYTHEPHNAATDQVADLLIVDASSLHLRNRISVLLNGNAPTEITHIQGTDIAYLSYGGFRMEKMESVTTNTTLTVRKINVRTGELHWEHVDEVSVEVRK